jgi:cysteine desulfurase
MRVYLDHNATTRLRPEARAAMEPFLDAGNPSSIHAEGRRARDAVERARDQVAALVGGAREEIVFTSGGTESNNLALAGLRAPGRHGVARAPIEHPSVAARDAIALPVDARGQVTLVGVAAALGREPALIAVQLANHELGTIQPVAAIARLARQTGTPMHSDAVQAAGKLRLDVRALGVDTLALSSHKLGGPKGVGALWVRRGVDLPPLHAGGHQERERRPGTENVAGIVGFGAACARAAADLDERVAATAALRNRLEAGLVALGARVHGGGERVCNTCNVGFDGVDGELLVAALDLAGIAASTGAACSSGSVEPSPVVLAIYPDGERARAREAVRFSLGWDTRADDLERVLAIVPSLIERIRRA